jgi:hypothetical protein
MTRSFTLVGSKAEHRQTGYDIQAHAGASPGQRHQRGSHMPPAIEDPVESPMLKDFAPPESKDMRVRLASVFRNRRSTRWLVPPIKCFNASQSHQTRSHSSASLLIAPPPMIAMESIKGEDSAQTCVKSHQDAITVHHRG